MARLLQIACLAAVAALCAASAAEAEVRITFVHPDRYADAGAYPQGGAQAQAITEERLQRYLQHAGERYAGRGRTLSIDVLDIDLAGIYESLRTGLANVRIMRAATWPKIGLRYSLRERDRVLASGEEIITDQNYQLQPVYASDDSLRYEKAMLDDWLRTRFGVLAAR